MGPRLRGDHDRRCIRLNLLYRHGRKTGEPVMDAPAKPRYGIDPYLEWVKAEGIPVAEDYGIDLFAVETAMWPRFGVKAAACHLKGRGDFANMFVFDIPPGGATAPTRHLYEEVVYVLE